MYPFSTHEPIYAMKFHSNLAPFFIGGIMFLVNTPL